MENGPRTTARPSLLTKIRYVERLPTVVFLLSVDCRPPGTCPRGLDEIGDVSLGSYLVEPLQRVKADLQIVLVYITITTSPLLLDRLPVAEPWKYNVGFLAPSLDGLSFLWFGRLGC